MAAKGVLACGGFAIILIIIVLTFTASLITVVKVWDLKNPKEANRPKTDDNNLNIPDPQVIESGNAKFKEFQEYATALKSTMNTTYKPCNNFYSYVCQNMPPNTNEFGILNGKTTVTMVQALNGNLPDFEAMNKLKGLLSKCISDALKPKLEDGDGSKVLPRLDAFKKIANDVDFPILSDPNPNLAKPTLEQRSKIIQYLSYRSLTTFTGEGLAPLMDSTMNNRATTIVFSEPSLASIWRNPYYYRKHYDTVVKPGLTKQWTRLAKKLAKVKKVALKDEQLNKDIEALLALDKHISTLVADPTKPELTSDKYKFFTAATATSTAAIVDFKVYLTAFAEGQSQALRDKILADDYKIAVENPTALKALADYLNSDKVDARTIYNYFYIRLLKLYEGGMSGVKLDESKIAANLFRIPEKIPFPAPIPPKRPDDEEEETTLMLAEVSAEEKAKFTCALQLKSIPYFRNLIDRVYMETRLPRREDRDRKLAAIQEVTEYILDGFRAQINQLSWTPAAKTRAYAKLDNLQLNLLYPEDIFDNDALNTEFADFSLDEKRSFDEELENILLTLMKKQEFAQLLSTTIARTDFSQSIAITNAWYNPTLNSINIPEGILQPPFFAENFPLAASYGSLGVVLGHEIVHGFDNSGVEFDSNGKLNPWLDDESKKDFEAMAKCVIGQYNEFEGDDGTKIIGAYTQGENIADNGGMRAAYNAYKAHSAITGDDPRLPSDDLKHITSDQLFFIAFAREFCGSSEITKETLNTDEHSPGKFRVFGTLQNFPPFKAAFNCRADDSYSNQKCEVYCKKKGK